MVHLSIAQARQLALRGQGLDGGWNLSAEKEGTAQVIERLGYVQIDTIAVVERAHHHTLWTRQPTYAPAFLHELQARDRRVFEYWAHAAAYVPMADYRYYRARMLAYAQNPPRWFRTSGEIVNEVLARIRAEGPLSSADFEAPEGFARGTWWNWKPAKRALEVLFSTGELMVSERRNFQRVYDLAERVLPPGIETTPPDPDEVTRFFVRRTLAAQGVASPYELGRGNRPAITRALQTLGEAGEVVPVAIEGVERTAYYALTAALETPPLPPDGRPLHILSPFDNLIIARRRLKELFGMDYSLECYLPAEKRRYGYFTLPVLWGTQFIGRVDAKAERKARRLLVRRLTFEPNVEPDEMLWPAFADKLQALAAFNGCTHVVVERADPETLAEPLRRALAG